MKEANPLNPNETNKTGHSKVARATGATIIAALTATAGVGAARVHAQGEQISRLQTQVNSSEAQVSTDRSNFEAKLQNQREKMQQDSADIAQEELLAAEFAKSQAAAYTQELNDTIDSQNPRSLFMQVLNGSVETYDKAGNPKGGPIPSYKNPILLSTLSANSAPDANGNFLAGAWIGVQGNDANGRIVITPVPFNPDGQKFVPNGTDPAVLSVNAYPAAAKGGPGEDVYELFAADPQGNTALQNPDGSPVMPGLAVGMK